MSAATTVATLGAIAVLAICGAGCSDSKNSDEKGAETKPHPESTNTEPPEPGALAAAMTKTSPIHDIPLPNDAAPIEDFDGAVSTKAGTVAQLTAFYRGWMAAHGWTFEEDYSTMDPNEGVKKSLGFTTNQIWCKRTSPITTVSIIVGSGDSTDHDKEAEVIVMELPDEESCP